MRVLNQLMMILILWSVGEYISSFIQNVIVIPGSIIGMIFLFILLQIKIIKLEDIKETSSFFLDNMAIFFIPAGVSLISSLDIITSNIVVLIISIFISTTLVMYITGKAVEVMIQKKTKER